MIIRSITDFPAPFGPINPTRSPCQMVSFTPEKTFFAPKQIEFLANIVRLYRGEDVETIDAGVTSDWRTGGNNTQYVVSATLTGWVGTPSFRHADLSSVLRSVS